MRRLFLLVAAVVLVDTAFYAAVTPLLPHYSAELGLSKTAAGVLSASYAAGTVIGSIPGGWLAARAGVKPTLLLGLAVLGVTSVVFGLAEDIVLLDSARFMQGVGGACTWAAALAWLTGAAPRERRGELIGSAVGAAIVGMILGPVVGGAATVIGPEPVFGFFAVLSAGLAAWAWATPAVPAGEEPSLRRFAGALRHPPVIAGFWLFTLPALFAGVLEVLAPLRLDDLGASGVAIGAVFLAAAGVEAAVSPVAGRVSDRRGRIAPVRVGLAGAAASAILLPLPAEAWLLGAAVVACVASLGTFWAPAMALLSDASEASGLDQGFAFALANLAWAAGHVVGGAGGAALAEATADAFPYAVMALLCTATFVVVARSGQAQAPHGAVPLRR
jgi:MFS family permease